MGKRVGGKIEIKTNGDLLQAKGEFTYNLGVRKKTGVAGTSDVAGYSDETKIPFIEGAITDSATLDVKALREIDDASVTLVLANGKVIALRDAWEASDGDGTTGEGELQLRFEGLSAEEIT